MKKQLLYSCFAGILLAVSFPPFPLFFTAFFAFIPLFFAIKEMKRKHILCIYAMFFFYHLISNWWISTLQENSDPYLFWAGIALDILHPVFFFFPFILLYFATRLIGWSKAIWTFPLLWTFFEYLHTIGDLGYSWLSVAHTQYYNLLWFQILDIQSIYLPVLIILYANVLIYKMLESRLERKANNQIAHKFNKTYMFALWLLIVSPLIYGWAMLQQYDFDEDYVQNENNDFINVALVQPNENPWSKWDTSESNQINKLTKLTDSLLQNDTPIHLVVWPETAIPMVDYSINADLNLGFVDNILLQHNSALLTGIARMYFYEPDETPAVTAHLLEHGAIAHYNSAVLYQPQRQNKAQVYDKIRLTPLAERFPYVEQLAFMKDVFMWDVGISNWTRGANLHPLILHNDSLRNTAKASGINYDNLKVGILICIESIHPHHVRDLVNNGANLLVVITNDSWYDGSSGPRQHYIIAAARAVEQRRYVARCANSGVSGFISPTGRSMKEAPQYQRVAVSASVPLMPANELTFYAKWGDILPYICIIVAVLIVVICNMKKNKEGFDKIGVTTL